jgi:hypothetical protein
LIAIVSGIVIGELKMETLPKHDIVDHKGLRGSEVMDWILK